MIRLALVDCNNFFCSCERVFNPALQGKPIVVLSNNDGCIISRSEEAKALGIPMGAPLHEQQEVIRKHDVRVFSSNYTLYGDMSARVMSILREEVPAIEVYSIDEAFLGLPSNFTEENARALRAKVLQWTGIPVCIGIGITKLLAKLANRHAKKNREITGGVFDLASYWDPDGIMAATPTDGLWGVGRNLSLRLKGMGITTALEFKQTDPAAIRRSMGVIGERMLRELNGIPCLELEEMPPDKKGVMASRSFGTLVESIEELEEALANHVALAAEKIRRYGLLATRMEVFLRTNRFRKEDPQYCPGIGITLDRPSNATAELMTTARGLLQRIYRTGYRYKKTGVQLTNLVSEEGFQPSLFDQAKPGRIDVDKIVDEINRRMGDPKNPVITRASQGTERPGKWGSGWRMKSERHSPHYTTDWNQLPEVSASSHPPRPLPELGT
jgi:DNA polymerase V